MEKTISRRKIRWAIVVFWLFAAAMFVAVLSRSVMIYAVGCVLGVVYVVLYLAACRCPYCGCHFRGHYWSKMTAGYCRKCGKRMEFDA